MSDQEDLALLREIRSSTQLPFVREWLREEHANCTAFLHLGPEPPRVSARYDLLGLLLKLLRREPPGSGTESGIESAAECCEAPDLGES